MATNKTIKELYEYVRENGGVSTWAGYLDLRPPSMYAKLNGRRRITPDEAVMIEKHSAGRFSKERLIFGKV